MSISGLIEGRIVHFIPPNNDSGWKNPNRHVPGIICRVCNKETGLCNLRVFADGYNDNEAWKNHTWFTDVPYDETGKINNSWHFIEKTE